MSRKKRQPRIESCKVLKVESKLVHGEWVDVKIYEPSYKNGDREKMHLKQTEIFTPKAEEEYDRDFTKGDK